MNKKTKEFYDRIGKYNSYKDLSDKEIFIMLKDIDRLVNASNIHKDLKKSLVNILEIFVNKVGREKCGEIYLHGHFKGYK